MRASYKNTQTGQAILVGFGVIAVILVAVYFLARPPYFPLCLLLGVCAACSLLFGWLTIQINKETLRWSFGPGLISKKVELKEIASAEPVRNAWYHGWGIHYTRNGWLYNVSGLDAVQVTLNNGKQFRLGTDEPEALTAAIRAVIRKG